MSIHSLEEQRFVQSLIKNYDPAQGSVWIGFSDIHEEGRWLWSDGSALDFAFWGDGQPDNGLGYEECARQNYGGQLKWNDAPCSQTFPFVCATRVCP